MDDITKGNRNYKATFQDGTVKTLQASCFSTALSRAIEGAHSPSENRLVAIKETTDPFDEFDKRCKATIKACDDFINMKI